LQPNKQKVFNDYIHALLALRKYEQLMKSQNKQVFGQWDWIFNIHADVIHMVDRIRKALLLTLVSTYYSKLYFFAFEKIRSHDEWSYPKCSFM